MAIKRRNLLLGSGGTLLLSLFPWEIAYGAGIVDVRIWPRTNTPESRLSMTEN